MYIIIIYILIKRSTENKKLLKCKSINKENNYY